MASLMTLFSENTTAVYSMVCTVLVLSEAIQPEVNRFAGIKGSPALTGLERSKSQDYNDKYSVLRWERKLNCHSIVSQSTTTCSV